MQPRAPYLLNSNVAETLQRRAVEFFTQMTPLLDEFVFFLQQALDSKGFIKENGISRKKIGYLRTAKSFIDNLIKTSSLFADFVHTNANKKEKITGTFNPDNPPLKKILKTLDDVVKNNKIEKSDDYSDPLENAAIKKADKRLAKLRKLYYSAMCSLIEDAIVYTAAGNVSQHIKFDMSGLDSAITSEEFLEQSNLRSDWIKNNNALVDYTLLIHTFAYVLSQEMCMQMSVDKIQARINMKEIASMDTETGRKKLSELVPFTEAHSKRTATLLLLCNDEDYNENLLTLSNPITKRNQAAIAEADEMISRYFDLVSNKNFKKSHKSSEAKRLHKKLTRAISHLNKLDLKNVENVIKSLEQAMTDEKNIKAALRFTITDETTDPVKEKLDKLSLIKKSAAPDNKEQLIKSFDGERKLLEAKYPLLNVTPLNDQAFFSSSGGPSRSTKSRAKYPIDLTASTPDLPSHHNNTAKH